MLGLKPFYHKSIRNLIISFGAVFNDISIQRFDKTNTATGTMKVPLAYAPKEKMLVRINQDIAGATTDGADVSMILPRMSFEITGFQHDAIRQKSPITKLAIQNAGTNDNVTTVFDAVPYVVNLELSIFAKYQDDALQIVEQILPYFAPRFTISVFETSLNVKRDIPITLEGVSYQDSYDGDFRDRRAIIYTLNFTAKINIYGSVDASSTIIKDITVNIGHNETCNPVVGEEMSQINVVPNPLSAEPDDDFGFTTSINIVERT